MNCGQKSKSSLTAKKHKEMYFAAIIIQSKYVGMPIYTDKSLTEVIKPELLSKLKGKSCFHITENDPKIFKQMKEALMCNDSE